MSIEVRHFILKCFVKKSCAKDCITEFVLIGSCQQLIKVSFSHIAKTGQSVPVATSVRNLRVWFDSHLRVMGHKQGMPLAIFLPFT